MSDDNIKDAISKITSKEYQESFSEESVVYGYTIDDEIINPESDECFCKSVFNANPNTTVEPKHYIKTGTDGLLFNPWGMFSEGTQGDYARTRGKSKWVFSEVNHTCLGLYRWFLKTRNRAYLSNAEREMR
tara:strand:- start:895 stop:1287 length:393 start_codon:yes stop_codon:yes gene_type:complete